MEQVAISIILPVYNVAKYLKTCLESILSQTFSNFELICINDGSSDKSLKILEEYKLKDDRILIIDKENGGLSSARNVGLDNAKGEFICFIDADDWISFDMLEKLYHNITHFNSDIVFCSVHLFDEKTQTFIDNDEYFNLSFFSSAFDNKSFSYKDVKSFLMDVPVMAWGKIFRRSFIENFKTRFQEGLIFEDGPFFFNLFFKTKKVTLIRDLLYFYRINRDGSILQTKGNHFIDIIDVVNLMYFELKQSDIFNDVKYEFYKRKIEEITYRYSFLNKRDKKLYKEKMKKFLCLTNKREFNYKYILENIPVILYKNFCKIQGLNALIRFYREKFNLRLIKKILQIINTDENDFYIKLWSVKFYIKKYKKIFNVYYEKNRINVSIFNKILVKWNIS